MSGKAVITPVLIIIILLFMLVYMPNYNVLVSMVMIVGTFVVLVAFAFSRFR